MKKKLVLDLDETLIYSSMERVDEEYYVELHAGGTAFYTTFRPGVREFLEFVRDHFDVTIWTTGQQAYLEAIWAYLGLEGFTLWGRDYCTRRSGALGGAEPYEKPLVKITDDLTQIVIVDNMPMLFEQYPQNGIQARTWRGDPEDTELFHLSHYLGWLSTQPSMRRDHQAWRLEALCIRSR